MVWGLSWGKAWAAAFGDTATDTVVITGSGAVEQKAGQVSGTGYIPGGAVQLVAPDLYPGGVPSTTLLRESAERNGFILTGDGRADQLPSESHGGARIKLQPLLATATASQPCGDASGTARIKLVSLVAASASVSHGSGESSAAAEFRDIELEMVAMLLAA